MPDAPSPESKDSLINVGDFAGLSKPFVKLITTIEAGCGRLANALWLNKKDVDNEVYRIEKTGTAETKVLVERARAIGELTTGGQHLAELNIASGSIQAQLTQDSYKPLTLIERGNNRVAYQNAMSQLNIEAINGFAANALENETQVSDEPVSQTWINRFYRTGGDVSEPEIQAIWGRILAGEVKQPGSFSLRTIGFLSTLTQSEANDFQRLCSYLWKEKTEGLFIALEHSAQSELNKKMLSLLTAYNI
ncbi:DUF2806 domain-containing protein [Hymenobacter sp. B1770]|uniref:DUF2806 domain-containing protein n=1 Tax=Hymenobacter sp. B1770 TaxID=1718788 RepID=UPI003CF58011